tara:strand:+ start:4585 stop:5064 length:480 start_codon:yes stop_codon:yes gene_type:complete
MAILSFTVKGADIGKIDGHRVKLHRSMKIKYLKLLHIYHNIETSNLSTEDDRDQQRVIFASLNFVNSDEVYNSTEENNFITIGGTKHDTSGQITNRDLYKVLFNGGCKYLNQDIIIKFYYLDHDAQIKQFTASDVVAVGADGNSSYISLSFEYTEVFGQ